MSKNPPKLTIGVLASRGELFSKNFPIFWQCLQNQTFQDFEVLMWDNYNLPENKTFITQNFPKIKFSQSQKGNLGWGSGHNQMLQKSQSEFYLCLNYSQVFDSDFLENLISAISQNPKFAAAAPKLLKWPRDLNSSDPIPELKTLPSQTIDSIGFCLHSDFRVTNFQEGESDQSNFSNPALIFGGTGAALLLRKSALEQIKISSGQFFDENFWMWKEDVDLAFRITLNGFKTVFVPDAISWYRRSASASLQTSIFHIAKNRLQRSNYASNKFHSSFGQNLLLAKFFQPLKRRLPFKIRFQTYFHHFLRKSFEFIFEPVTFWRVHSHFHIWQSQASLQGATFKGGTARGATFLLSFISHPHLLFSPPKSSKPKISLSILGYGIGRKGLDNYVAAHYETFLTKALASRLDFPVEIFVVLNDHENQAWHDLAARFTTQTQNSNLQIHFVKQQKIRSHRGFTSYTTPHNFAHNFLATGEIRITTNEDINLEPDTFSQIVDFMDKNPQAGVMAPRMIFPDQRVMPTARAFPRLHTQVINRLPLLQKLFKKEYERYHHLQKPIFSPLSVDWVCGHFFVIRESAWKNIKGKDERFFRYMSDVDLCKTAHCQNWEVIYNPEITIVNRRPLSSPGGFLTFLSSKMMQIHLLDALRYFWKWKGK